MSYTVRLEPDGTAGKQGTLLVRGSNWSGGMGNRLPVHYRSGRIIVTKLPSRSNGRHAIHASFIVWLLVELPKTGEWQEAERVTEFPVRP
jgi:hypothetical protein